MGVFYQLLAWWTSLSNVLAVNKILVQQKGAKLLRGLIAKDPSYDADNETIEATRRILAYGSTIGVDRVTHLATLSSALLSRSARTHSLEDLNDSISAAREAISCLSETDQNITTLLDTLARSQLRRFEFTGQSIDVRDAVANLKKTLVRRPPGHQSHYTTLLSLAKALQTRFAAYGEFEDLHDSLDRAREALSIFNPERHDRLPVLTSLSAILLCSHAHSTDPAELKQSIEYAEEALTHAPPDSPGRSLALQAIARSLMARHVQEHQITDLNSALEYGREYVQLSAPGDPARISAMQIVTAVLLSRYEQAGHQEDLDQSIILATEAVSACNPDMPVRPTLLDTLAAALVARFICSTSEADLQAAIEHAQHSLALRPAGHPDRPHPLVYLASARSVHFVFSSSEEDLQGSIELLREAMGLLQPKSTFYPFALCGLADALLSRYMLFGDSADLNQSITYAIEALAACVPTAKYRAGILNCLGNAMGHRYEHTGDTEDLKASVKYIQDGLGCCAEGAPMHTPLLIALMSSAIPTSFALGKRDILLRSSDQAHNALASKSCTSRHLLRPALLGSLSPLMGHKAELSKSTELFDRAFTLAEEAVSSCPMQYIMRPAALLELANAHATRFTQNGVWDHLDRAIECARTAISLCSATNPLRPYMLQFTARYFQERFARDGDLEDLDLSIQYFEASLTSCPPRSPARPQLMSAISNAWVQRSLYTNPCDQVESPIEYTSNVFDRYPLGRRNTRDSSLSEDVQLVSRSLVENRQREPSGAIQYSGESLSPDHPDHIWRHDRGALDTAQTSVPSSRNRLSQSHSASSITVPDRMTSSGSSRKIDRRKDLTRAIDVGHETLALCPPGHVDRVFALGNLSSSLRERFLMLGEVGDLDKAVEMLQETLELMHGADQQPFRMASLLELTVALGLRFHRTGHLDDIRDSIQYGYEALSLCAGEDHKMRLNILIALASSLGVRFIQMGRVEDSALCIALLREALAHAPPELRQRAALLTGLTGNLCFRLKKTRDPDDLRACLEYGEEAVRLHHPGHPYYAHVLYNLAWCWQCKYIQTKEPKDLDKAIEYFRQSSASLRDLFGSIIHFALINDICDALVLRYDALGNPKDLTESLYLSQKLLNACHVEDEHPERLRVLHNLASCLQRKYRISGDSVDIVSAISYAEESALCEPVLNRMQQLQSAILWAQLAHAQRHTSTLKAYRTCFELSERNLTLAPTLEMQHEVIQVHGTVPLDAAAYAIEQGNLELAVEMLEQGRAMLWSQVRRLRTPLDQMAEDKDLAPLRDAFMEKSRALEAISTSGNPFTLAADSGMEASESLSDNYGSMLETKRRLSKELNEVVTRIREKFPDFLRLPSYEKLKTVSAEGPVVVVNHSRYRSDALILGPGDNLSCVELSEDFFDRATQLSDDLLDSRSTLKTNPKKYDRTLRRTMKELGEFLVDPVCEKLRVLGIKEGSRIWWCPTSVVSALPLHAAGPLIISTSKPSKSKVYLPDVYIPSYTPTLTALIEARAARNDQSEERRGILGVALLDSSLKDVGPEVEVLKTYFEGRGGLSLAMGSDCTSEAVKVGLAQRPWAHFACHGTLKPGEPFNSAFMLSKTDSLTLLDVIRAGLHNAELAVLSACHTAEQTQGSASEEVLHLAAAMQFSGFRSVVGTMWQMQDEDGPTFAEHFYGAMFAGERLANASEVGFKKAARAYCAATKQMRRKVNLERWVNFVHIGA